jgi:hypothetical protein
MAQTVGKSRRSPSDTRKSHYSDPDKYFLGPFVFVDESRYRRFLVDGQQRFTTIHLILMHLWRAAEELKHKAAEDNLRRAIGEFDGGRIRFRIDIEERRPLLEAIYGGKPFEPRVGAPISVRNMASRSELIEELIDSRLTSDARPDFVVWLLNSVLLVGIKAGTRASGFKIFESMNDRGARLTSADLVKSFLISHATSYEEDLDRRWRAMLAKVTISREDANAPKEYLKTVFTAHYARLGEGESDAEEIETSLSAWVRKNYQERLELKGPNDYYRFLDGLLDLAEYYVRYLSATKRPFFENHLETLFYNNMNGINGQLSVVLAPIKPREPVGLGKQDESARYIDGSQWHIEHLWPVTQELREQDRMDSMEFKLARSRIGALTLLPGRDNEAYQDLPFAEKAKHYGRQPNLTAIFSQGHLFRNNTAKEFSVKNGITDFFHDFGPAASITEVIKSRTALYQRLANRVWDPVRIGFPAKASTQSESQESPEPSQKRTPSPKPSPQAALTRLVKAGVIPPNSQLIAGAGDYSATVDKNGIIWLPTGDAFNAVDEAGKAVSGEKRCDGLDFWRVQTAEGLQSLRVIRDNAQSSGRLNSKARRP